MTKKRDEQPWLTCGRCSGAGVVTVWREGDYLVEDSSPRELPITTCPECVGCGQVQESEAGA